MIFSDSKICIIRTESAIFKGILLFIFWIPDDVENEYLALEEDEIMKVMDDFSQFKQPDKVKNQENDKENEQSRLNKEMNDLLLS